MKPLPKLMKNSTVTVDIIFQEKPLLSVCISGSRTWPNSGRFDSREKVFRFFDASGALIHEMPANSALLVGEELPNFGLAFIGVTESRVDFETKSQFLIAKMRAIDLDAHENLHGDNTGYDD